MLIVEGADLAGKTTLCQQLLKSLPDHVYSHYTRLPDGHDGFWHYVQSASKYHVQDRFHLSEVVYARVRGEETNLNLWYDLLDGLLKWHFQAFTVLLIPTDRSIAERWREGEMYEKHKVLEANHIFHELRNRADYYTGYDRSWGPRNVETILTCYNKWRRQCDSLRSSPYSVTLP